MHRLILRHGSGEEDNPFHQKDGQFWKLRGKHTEKPHNPLSPDERGQILHVESRQYKTMGKEFVAGLRTAPNSCSSKAKSDSSEEILSSSTTPLDVNRIIGKEKSLPLPDTHTAHTWIFPHVL